MGNVNRFPLHGAAILAVMLLLPGCIPWSISLAMSAISYATTGKSVSDHVISELVQKDCNVGRAILDQSDVCQEPDDLAIIAVEIDDSLGIGLTPAAGKAN